jgi:hypothetical protein
VKETKGKGWIAQHVGTVRRCNCRIAHISAASAPLGRSAGSDVPQYVREAFKQVGPSSARPAAAAAALRRLSAPGPPLPAWHRPRQSPQHIPPPGRSLCCRGLTDELHAKVQSAGARSCSLVVMRTPAHASKKHTLCQQQSTPSFALCVNLRRLLCAHPPTSPGLLTNPNPWEPRTRRRL